MDWSTNLKNMLGHIFFIENPNRLRWLRLVELRLRVGEVRALEINPYFVPLGACLAFLELSGRVVVFRGEFEVSAFQWNVGQLTSAFFKRATLEALIFLATGIKTSDFREQTDIECFGGPGRKREGKRLDGG